MEVRLKILFIILGGGLVTLLLRVIPLVFLNKKNLNDKVIKWLNQIPVAIISALLAQELLFINGKVTLINNEKIYAAIPTILVAFLTKSLLGTVITGVFSMIIINLII